MEVEAILMSDADGAPSAARSLDNGSLCPSMIVRDGMYDPMPQRVLSGLSASWGSGLECQQRGPIEYLGGSCTNGREGVLGHVSAIQPCETAPSRRKCHDSRPEMDEAP